MAFEKTFESKINGANHKILFVFFVKLFFPESRAILCTKSKFTQGEFIMGSVFETIMLICFGLSWPLNVIKAYKARTAKGTSLPFILLIITGYIAGITAKFVTHQINYVLVVYLLNLAIVSLNVAVYFRNAALDKSTKRMEAVKNA